MQDRDYEIPDAVAFLRQLHPGIKVTEDTLYHRINRKNLPAERKQTPHGKRLVIKESTLREAYFKTEKAVRKPQNWRRAFDLPQEFWSTFIPVEVLSDEDLKQLTAQFGELVNDKGLQELLHEKFGVWYSTASLKQRALRGALPVVGVNKPRGGRWYPKKAVDYLEFRPQMVKRRRKD